MLRFARLIRCPMILSVAWIAVPSPALAYITFCDLYPAECPAVWRTSSDGYARVKVQTWMSSFNGSYLLQSYGSKSALRSDLVNSLQPWVNTGIRLRYTDIGDEVIRWDTPDNPSLVITIVGAEFPRFNGDCGSDAVGCAHVQTRWEPDDSGDIESCNLAIDKNAYNPFSSARLKSIAIHEAGHCLGLGHTKTNPPATSIMHWQQQATPVTTLAADDRQGIQSLYGSPMLAQVMEDDDGWDDDIWCEKRYLFTFQSDLRVFYQLINNDDGNFWQNARGSQLFDISPGDIVTLGVRLDEDDWSNDHGWYVVKNDSVQLAKHEERRWSIGGVRIFGVPDGGGGTLVSQNCRNGD